jgi:PST family polysaccharide transporter
MTTTSARELARVDSAAQAAEAVGERARQGSIWMVGATGAAKGIGLLSQLALAWLMSRREFGVYAIAISLTVLLSVMKDGGLPTVLVQKARHFDRYAGPVFWLMLTINTATGLAIAAAARPAARFYHEPELYAVIALFAITVPLYVPASLLTLRMTAQMRFRELGIVQVVSAVLRNVLLVLFAWNGFGAESFILPLLVTNVTDALLLWYLTRHAPWSRPARVHLWPKLMRSGRWVLLGTFSFAFSNNGVYFLLGKLLPSETIGTYFFAFQVITLLGMLLANNSYQVLFAAFSRVAADTVRLRAAVSRATNAIALIASVASLSVAVIFRPLEHLLWHGKWATALGAVEIFAVVWPAVALVSVLHAVQAAQGHFRLWGAIAFITALAAVSGSGVGAVMGRSAEAAAVGYAIGSLAGLFVNVKYSLALLDLRVTPVMNAALRPWLAATLAAALAICVGRLIGDGVVAVLGSILTFSAIAFLLLRLVANDSLQLVLETSRRMLGPKLFGRTAVMDD